MSYGTKLVKQLDKHVAATENRRVPRGHLGASVLGKKCVRQVWYGWRWARTAQHQGRLLRLFARGHREEDEMVRRLRDLGLEVRQYEERLVYHDGSDSFATLPWEQELPLDVDDVHEYPDQYAVAARRGVSVQQWGFTDHSGHFSGSGDGIITAMLEMDGPGLFECKTHGEKSFIELAGKLEDWRKHVTAPDKSPFTGKGVITAKIEHYVQMQLYMHYLNLKWALYAAVCKNTDDLYFEVIYYKSEVAEAYVDRAAAIIAARHPPARISQDPSWWECRFCDFREICHRGQAPQKNCRSCIYAAPVDNGQWMCDKYHQIIPPDFIRQGCDGWEPLA